MTVIQHRVTCPPILITAMVNSPRHAELEPRLSCCIKLRDVIFEHVDLVILYEDSNFNIMNPNEINLARDALLDVAERLRQQATGKFIFSQVLVIKML